MSLPPPPGQPQDPGPYGEPQYPPAWGGPPAYGQPAYGAPGYGAPGYGPPGYPSPYGYPSPRPARRSLPALGWALLGAGLVAVLGSVTPWASVHLFGVARDINGTDGDGKLTIVLALVAAAMGLLVALRQGYLWTSIVGLVAGVLIALIALIDVADITGVVGPGGGVPEDIVSISYGLWLVLVGGLAALGLSIAAMVRRSDQVAPGPGADHERRH